MFVPDPLVHDLPRAADSATAVPQAPVGRAARGQGAGGVLDALLVALSSARRERGD
jgi:hypothetical protein